MPTYICLTNFTDQGIHDIRQTTQRSKAAIGAAAEFGVTFKEHYWTFGMYDTVAVVDASSDEAIAAFVLRLSSHGNIRVQTARAFSTEEMNGILSKIP